MKFSCLVTILVFAILCATANAEPWSVDLEESVQSLPWVFTADVIEVTDSGVTAVISETFRGEHQSGDTLRIPYWKMGSWMSEIISEGDEYLLLPDVAGGLQIIGTPGDGFWLLRGYYDFNAFITEPGVLNMEELLLLCSGDSLPDRCVEMEIRFAGGSEFLEVVFRESDDIWHSRSHFACMDNLILDKRALTMGGWDTYPQEPEVFMRVSTSGGGLVFFHGKMGSCSDGMYTCNVYPTGLLILDSSSLAKYITRDQMPETIRIGIELSGAEPAELGLADEPFFALGESGALQLSGADGMFNIPIIYITDYDSRPVAGFDSPASNDNPLYFRFENLPDGPSGHLATDIIDALAKGTVTGSVGIDPEHGSARFSLFIIREE
ncbi:hypothetical protein DRQ25_08475 [Candidatus Fermentibacteria bacterium]|nr:MAG: hypothetical protein DRQ25_08475 [Candidatus Fermentibacteria bacterium]